NRYRRFRRAGGQNPPPPLAARKTPRIQGLSAAALLALSSLVVRAGPPFSGGTGGKLANGVDGRLVVQAPSQPRGRLWLALRRRGSGVRLGSAAGLAAHALVQRHEVTAAPMLHKQPRTQRPAFLRRRRRDLGERPWHIHLKKLLRLPVHPLEQPGASAPIPS